MVLPVAQIADSSVSQNAVNTQGKSGFSQPFSLMSVDETSCTAELTRVFDHPPATDADKGPVKLKLNSGKLSTRWLFPPPTFDPITAWGLWQDGSVTGLPISVQRPLTSGQHDPGNTVARQQHQGIRGTLNCCPPASANITPMASRSITH